MGIRESINKNKKASIAVVVLLAGGGIAGGWLLSRPDEDAVEVPLKAFYSDDDGKTYFADTVKRLPPFDHNGKVAYTARVYRCPDRSDPFVGYLERIEEKTLPLAQEAVATNKSAEDIERLIGFKREVKRPGDGTWVNVHTMEGDRIAAVQCDNARAVMPRNSDK